MRGALIGCGFFAQNHLSAWREMRADGVELMAVCDADLSRALAAVDTFGIARSYRDVAEMLDKEPLDFVDIATQMASHGELVAQAAARGIAVIVQKPLAPDWTSCVSIVETAARAGIRLAIHENFRYQTPMLELARLLRDGAIGKPTWARIAFRTGFDVYRTQPYFHKEKRLAILDVGIHVLDMARVLMGEVVHVSCETQIRNPANQGEDTATLLLRHESGAVSVVECTYEAMLGDDPFPQTMIAIEGDAGSITLQRNYRIALTQGARGALRSRQQIARPPERSWTVEPWRVVQESVLSTQQAILRAWRGGHEAETSGRDNLKTFALVEAAYAAANEGRRIEPRQYDS
jgi:D-apiose dehydrogenase